MIFFFIIFKLKSIQRTVTPYFTKTYKQQEIIIIIMYKTLLCIYKISHKDIWGLMLWCNVVVQDPLIHHFKLVNHIETVSLLTIHWKLNNQTKKKNSNNNVGSPKIWKSVNQSINPFLIIFQTFCLLFSVYFQIVDFMYYNP